MKTEKLTFDQFKESVINDYRIICESREASLIGRKEVLTGKAKFGIFGDGKEVAQAKSGDKVTFQVPFRVRLSDKLFKMK